MASRPPSMLLTNTPAPFTCGSLSPGCTVTTIITSNGRHESDRPPTSKINGKRRDKRKRYPAIEATFQMVFRAVAFSLLVTIVGIVWALDGMDGDAELGAGVGNMYGLIGYCILLNTLEFLALLNPSFRLLGVPSPFPRLPPLCLALAETAALGMIIWTGTVLLNEHCTDEMRPVNCPALTCVTAGEKLGVYGYMVAMFAGLVHTGFWFGAWMGLGKGLVP
ncbi:hypothetical protein K458DRAFT_383984 [Lentithecium fluviatile CBS 122367]|uniref:Uncharacterized protein n=1 Tax=Lentithecium fluviatile CBS 122367 TaxID=1168545 RepID=A0A6G1JGS3_9PLEO|nr:hypothetical protein K458DRAFT_383984 [Lentithecium fluviatile CBS 122367]